mmetsp:Transcript_135350/g.270086  ORF Transcript_135350/g.270086 Transcript_135350/m.270086 type:complete len:105 (-) Transcript_135350:277-591(-)
MNVVAASQKDGTVGVATMAGTQVTAAEASAHSPTVVAAAAIAVVAMQVAVPPVLAVTAVRMESVVATAVPLVELAATVTCVVATTAVMQGATVAASVPVALADA